ncbi:unnamed protein product [Cylicocyclus nassatus]|uniref:Ig-like domain-containing protein n=1 Tax=Cylicocyclus nassatus TaxID=53992 RepID=A0AA36H307_CYLNA|nr:unnamed protein product [Cylicocyclus nassatus]
MRDVLSNTCNVNFRPSILWPHGFFPLKAGTTAYYKLGASIYVGHYHRLLKKQDDDPKIFAKRSAFPLTGGAYTDNKKALQLCLNRVDEKAETGGIFKAPCEFDNEKFTCKAYTAVLPTKKAIVIAFRGTDQGFAQLVREAWQSIGFKEKWPYGGYVSGYFSQAFQRLWAAGLDKQVTGHLAKYSGYEIWITGHSLGGAIANLAASWVKSLPGFKGKVKLVTFGSPRVGNKEFSDALEKSVQYVYRVTHRKDPVVHIPNVNYQHAGKEIYYKNGMTYSTEPCDVAKDKENCFVTCAKSEDSKCAQSITVNWLSPAIDDHNKYFGGGVTISDWGDHGCL